MPANYSQQYVYALCEQQQRQAMREGQSPELALPLRLLREHGRSMPRSRSKQHPMPLGSCYQNAATVALHDSQVLYCEGYAVAHKSDSPWSCPHAWLLSPTAEALEVAWASGTYYFGVVFRADFLRQFLQLTQHYGVLQNVHLLQQHGPYQTPAQAYAFLVSGLHPMCYASTARDEGQPVHAPTTPALAPTTHRTVTIGGTLYQVPRYVTRTASGWQVVVKGLPSAHFADSHFGGAHNALAQAAHQAQLLHLQREQLRQGPSDTGA